MAKSPYPAGSDVKPHDQIVGFSTHKNAHYFTTVTKHGMRTDIYVG